MPSEEQSTGPPSRPGGPRLQLHSAAGPCIPLIQIYARHHLATSSRPYHSQMEADRRFGMKHSSLREARLPKVEKVILMVQFHGLKLQYEFAAEGAAGPVEELAEPRALEIVLNITVVVAIEYVEDAKSDARMALLYREADPPPDL